MLDELGEQTEELAAGSLEQVLPASLLEALDEGQPRTLEAVADAVFESDELFGPGLRAEWSRVAEGDLGDQEAFREAVAVYVTHPMDLYIASPEAYEYLREHVFLGMEYGDRSTMEQIRESVSSLESVEGLRPEVWEGLGRDQRAETLIEAERQLAAVEGRPATTIVFDIDEPGLQGYYRADEGVLHLRRDMLDAKTPADALDTVAHEGRHAYQNYCIEHPGTLGDADRENAWGANMPPGGVYLDPESYGYEAYQEQPVEKDAWAYGQAIRAGVYGGTAG